MATKLNAANAAAALDPEAPKRVRKAPVEAAPVAKRVRLSVDIDPNPYRALISWCQDVALKLGRTKINHVVVLREVIGMLLEDKAIQATVIDRVRETLAKADEATKKRTDA